MYKYTQFSQAHGVLGSISDCESDGRGSTPLGLTILCNRGDNGIMRGFEPRE